MPKGVAQEERYGGEMFIPGDQLHRAHVSRVIPVDAHVREHFEAPGWVEEHHESAFDSGEPVNYRSTFPGYHYDGPDVREFTATQHRHHARRIAAYQTYKDSQRH